MEALLGTRIRNLSAFATAIVLFRTLLTLATFRYSSNNHALETFLPEASAQLASSSVVENLWNASTVLPAWMKEYFEWHQEHRMLLNPDNWQSRKYLVLRCLESDRECGGTSDRLQPLPLAVRLAYIHKRILLIKWEAPAKLEEFLVPPKGGVNWSVPDWMQLEFRVLPLIYYKAGIKFLPNNNITVADMRYHFGKDHGAKVYNNRLEAAKYGGPTFDQVTHDLWDVFFEPSQPVQTLIDQHMKQLNLQPNQYTAIHIRSQYHYVEVNDTDITQNAVNCAVNLDTDMPVFVATDSLNVTQQVVKDGRSHGLRLEARHSNTPILHLDRGTNYLSINRTDWHQRPEPYYDTFVDLYLLRMAKCLAHGKGGYGRWSNLLSQNITCAINHAENQCEWDDNTTKASS